MTACIHEHLIKQNVTTRTYRFSNVVFNNRIKVNTSMKELYNGVGATLITLGFLTSQMTPLANIILFTTSDSMPF